MNRSGGFAESNKHLRRRIFHILSRLGPVLFFVFVLLSIRPGPAWSAGDLPERIKVLVREYEAQANLTRDARALAVNFCKCGETWQLVASHVAGRLEAKAALSFLEKALTSFQAESAKTKDIEQTKLAGLNLFYQSADALAIVLALYNHDHEALKQIKTSENRVLGVIGQTEEEEAVLAALSAGIMTMLSVVADQVDREDRLDRVLTAEIQLRGQLDNNIGSLKDIGVQERMLLLTNNHLNGAFSMMQIMGLALNPELKPDLKSLQDQLHATGDADLESQLLAAARTLSKAGFLIGPLFVDLVTPDGKPADQSGKASTSD